jgi:hypothetical protein
MEGYAYLQNKMYGAQKGKFYTEKNVQLWMPARLLDISSTELNYIAARRENKLMLAFTNQSAKPVTAKVSIDPSRVRLNNKSKLSFYTGKQNSLLADSNFTISVPANGLVAVAIEGAHMQSAFQEKLLDTNFTASKMDYLQLKTGKAHAMLLQLGNYQRRLFVYLQEDDNKYRTASLIYTTENGQQQSITDNAYPFEFTVPLKDARPVSFSLSLIDIAGKEVKSETAILGQ